MQYFDRELAIAGIKAENYHSEDYVSTGRAKQAITYGMPVFNYVGESRDYYNYFVDTAAILFDGDWAAGTVTITVNGEVTANVVYAVSHANTMDLLVAAVRTLTITDPVMGDVDVDAALDPTDGTNRTLLIRTKGLTVAATMQTIVGGHPGITSTTLSCDQVFGGLAKHNQRQVVAAGGGYRPNDNLAVAEKGFFWAIVDNVGAQSKEAVTIDPANGLFSNLAAGENLINTFFKENQITQLDTGDFLAVVELRGQFKPNRYIDWS